MKHNWASGFCAANGIASHYLRTGGAKPPLVLLHGLMGNGACWTPLARTLEAEYDVIMPDARGHGKSATPPSGYRYEDHAGDVIALIQELGLAAPVLLGHSMGGMTAALVASQAAVTLRGLIFADPTFLTAEHQREVHASDVAGQHRQFLSQGRAEVLAQARVRHAHRAQELVELVAEARMQTRMKPFDVLTPPNPDYRALVRAIRVPTLLVTADDGVVSMKAAREMQDINPRVQVEQIQGAGHGLQYDQPERFAALVRSFLYSVSAL